MTTFRSSLREINKQQRLLQVPVICVQSYRKCKKFERMLTRRANTYSSSGSVVTHRSTNRARRTVTSFQPKRITNYAPSTPEPWPRLVNDIDLRSQTSEKIPQNPVFWRSRSSKVIEFGANRQPVNDFLLVINSYLGLISHRY